jgi:D-3-phosphoglycerate dehydrogenase
MPHILIAGKIHASGLALLAEAPGVTHTHIETIDEPSYLPHLPRADALVIRTQPLTAAGLATAPKLRIVSRHGVGYDAVDVAALNARGIPLCIVGDVNSVSVAEHAMMLILACAKQAIRSDRSVRQGPWNWRNRLEPVELAGRTLLIVGYGRIGRHLARMAAGFGMRVTAHDPFIPEAAWPAGAERVADLDAGLRAADVISLHLPKTRGALLNAPRIATLKPGAILVNTARGGLIDEAALAAALISGQVAAAGVDVFDAEPPDAANPLFALDNAILTPHTAGLSRESAERMAVMSVQNVLDHFAGRLDPALIVNRDAIR